MYIAVYIKFPKEGDHDNELAEWINSLKLTKTITIYEIGQLLFTTFNNLFHFITAVSRLVDVHPLEEMKDKVRDF